MEDLIQFIKQELPKKKRGRPRKKGGATDTDLEGEGWIGDQVKKVKKAAQKAARKVGAVVLGKKTAEKLERYGDAVLFLTNLPLPPSVKEYLRKYGDELISKIVIVRNPVQKLLTGAMDVASLGSFGKKMGRLPYDDLFHLQLWVTTPSGVFGIEKNEVITMTMNPKPKSNAEFQDVAVKPDITMNKLMLGSQKIQGDKWTRYDASNNNCQDFVMSLLKGSGLGNESNYKFVKQDTDSLFKDDSFLRKLSRNLTNIGASVSTALSGVDDDPIVSTKTSDTFEIPSPVDTDVMEAGRATQPQGRPITPPRTLPPPPPPPPQQEPRPTPEERRLAMALLRERRRQERERQGSGKGKKIPKKAQKGQPTIPQLTARQEEHARRLAYEASNPTYLTRVLQLLEARRRGEVDANFYPIQQQTPVAPTPAPAPAPTPAPAPSQADTDTTQPTTTLTQTTASLTEPTASLTEPLSSSSGVKRGRGRPRKMVGGYTPAQIASEVDETINSRRGLLVSRGITPNKMKKLRTSVIEYYKHHPQHPLTINEIFSLLVRFWAEY